MASRYLERCSTDLNTACACLTSVSISLYTMVAKGWNQTVTFMLQWYLHNIPVSFRCSKLASFWGPHQSILRSRNRSLFGCGESLFSLSVQRINCHNKGMLWATWSIRSSLSPIAPIPLTGLVVLMCATNHGAMLLILLCMLSDIFRDTLADRFVFWYFFFGASLRMICRIAVRCDLYVIGGEVFPVATPAASVLSIVPGPRAKPPVLVGQEAIFDRSVIGIATRQWDLLFCMVVCVCVLGTWCSYLWCAAGQLFFWLQMTNVSLQGSYCIRLDCTNQLCR